MNTAMLRYTTSSLLLAALLSGPGGNVDPPASQQQVDRTRIQAQTVTPLRNLRLVAQPDCPAGQAWNAERKACTDIPRDADRDGHDAIEFGGDDCDDQDANRFPGNVEVCDAEGHDEDCDFGTGGLRDLDNDGHVDNQCFNWGPPRGR